MATILLAAGASSRMEGGDKLMELVGGVPLIADRAACLAKPGHGTSDTIVVLRADRPARRAALADMHALTLIDNPAPEQGMGGSISIGISAVPKWCSAALILPADMPGITQNDIETLRNAHALNPRAILRGTTPDGVPGHPVLFPRACFKELAQLTGDQGARKVISNNVDTVEPVILPSDNATLDLDTPQDWAAWRERKH